MIGGLLHWDGPLWLKLILLAGCVLAAAGIIAAVRRWVS